MGRCWAAPGSLRLAAGGPAWQRRGKLGFPAPADAAASMALRRAETFQDALWRVFAAPPVTVA